MQRRTRKALERDARESAFAREARTKIELRDLEKRYEKVLVERNEARASLDDAKTTVRRLARERDRARAEAAPPPAQPAAYYPPPADERIEKLERRIAGQSRRIDRLTDEVERRMSCYADQVVDVDDLEASRADDKVRETLTRAEELYERFERSGRNL